MEALPSSSLASRQQWVAQEHPSCLFVKLGKGCNTRVPSSSHHMAGCHKPQARFLHFLPQEEESGECYTSHPDPAPCRHRPGVPVHFSQGHLACGDHRPVGEGCDRAGPSSWYEVGVLQPLLHCAQENRWITTDLGSASFESCTSQASFQDVDTETDFWVRPSPRLVCSDRPEGHVLSCLDPTQTISVIRIQESGISVQGPALRTIPVTSRLHQSRGGGPCSSERTGCTRPQLPR